MEEKIYAPLTLNPPLNPILVTDGAGLDRMMNYFRSLKTKIIGWDKETPDTKGFFWRKDRTWQFGDQNEQYVIDLLHFVDGDVDALQTQGYYGVKLDSRLKRVADVTNELVCSGDYLKCGVNLGFEYEQSYWNFGQRTWQFWSCDMVERVIWAGAHSLKDYDFFSMEEMVKRYFNRQVDKSLQRSFNLTDPLTTAQVTYAALDTRIPLALRMIQLRNKYVKGSSQTGGGLIEDRLVTVAQIENNAIGAFSDMHIHGQRINREKWKKRDDKNREALKAVIADLDKIALPIVGSKHDVISEEQIATMKEQWKAKTSVSDEELELKKILRKEKDPAQVYIINNKLSDLAFKRLEEKERLKKLCSEAGKRRTKVKNLAADCEGEALLNYSSKAQVLEFFKNFKDLKNIEECDDDTLKHYDKNPFVKAYRKYAELSKQVSTYGRSFYTEWTTKPCSEEGWLHPGDGRLHPQFNQLEAETGRSSSSQPNGQNLPQDKELRSCFEADPPDESIRITRCCQTEALSVFPTSDGTAIFGICPECGVLGPTDPEEYVIVTADMSGAELRIIAELAGAPSWINAFARGEDVHAVGTELMYPEKWPKLTVASLLHPENWTMKDVKTELVPLYNEDGTPKTKEKDGKIVPVMVPPCAYFACKDNGDHARQKCDCPEHKKLRDGNKSTNFLLAYGGVAATLAERIGVKLPEAEEIMRLHKAANPEVWDYLEKSGKMAIQNREARSMFDRRRQFPEPTFDSAREKLIEEAKSDSGGRWEKVMRKEFSEIYEDLGIPLPAAKPSFKEVQKAVVEVFERKNSRKPKKEELYELTHLHAPPSRHTSSMLAAMWQRIERQGKNHCIQSTNADIAKLAMGCGFCKNGIPFLWHTLPQYKAKQLAFVHDELIVLCPKRYGQKVADLIGDAFKRAAAERMTKVIMEFDYHIAQHWQK